MRFSDTERRRLSTELERQLGPAIAAALRDPKVVEIVLNADGWVRVERLGEGFVRTDERLGPAQVLAAIKLIATQLDKVVHAERPILEGELPGDGSRVEAVIAPASVGGPLLAIRKRALLVYSLDDYVAQGRMTPAVREMIGTLVRQRENILVVGGTGSGKTTLVNAVLREIAAVHPHHRIVVVEDTRELQCEAENFAQLQTTEFADHEQLLRATLRLRPDRIVVGEVRGGEALTLLKAWNTGHPGGVSTIHANSCRAGLLRLEQMAAERVAGQPPRAEIAEAVQALVHVERGPSGPRVVRVERVLGLSGNDYVLKEVAA